MPAITACLIVSLLAISIVDARLEAVLAQNSSSAARVPEPGSRTMSGSVARSAAPARARCARTDGRARVTSTMRMHRERLGARGQSRAAAGP